MNHQWVVMPNAYHPLGATVERCTVCGARRSEGFRVYYSGDVVSTGALEYAWLDAASRVTGTSVQEPPCEPQLEQGNLFAWMAT